MRNVIKTTNEPFQIIDSRIEETNELKYQSTRGEIKYFFLRATFQNEGKPEKRIHMGRESPVSGKRRNLSETIAKAQEDNVRLRKKHDLIKYQREKVSNERCQSVEEYSARTYNCVSA